MIRSCQIRKLIHCSISLYLLLAALPSRLCGDYTNSVRIRLDFKSISGFNNFIKEFKTKSVDNLRSDGVPESFIVARNAIMDLEKVISAEDICASHKIDEIVSYHKMHFSSGYQMRPITYDFFKKYAVQVAYICKKNLILNLERAREELSDNSKVFEEAKEKIFNEEPSLKSNIQLLQDQPSEPVTVNVKPKDEIELTLSEYREALKKLKKPEDILTFDADECEQSRHRYTRISIDKIQTFFKPALMCHQLHRYYAGSILSVARLANLGYIAQDTALDSQLIDDPMLRDWIIAAQVCDPMLHLYVKESRDGWAIVDNCASSVPVIELMVYEDTIDSFDEKLLREMVPRSRASSRSDAQKSMKSALKTMAKANLLKEFKSGTGLRGIFKKSLAMFATQTVAAESLHKAEPRFPSSFSIHFTGRAIPSWLGSSEQLIENQKSDEESYDTLMRALSGGIDGEATINRRNGLDSAVSFFDPMSSLVSFFTVMAIMLSFEWIFFIVMTLAARICHHMYLNFDNLLTFPPKIVSWSDADFASLSDRIERLDEDDFYDDDELTPDERNQRDLLRRVFGKLPPMMYRD